MFGENGIKSQILKILGQADITTERFVTEAVESIYTSVKSSIDAVVETIGKSVDSFEIKEPKIDNAIARLLVKKVKECIKELLSEKVDELES